MEGSKASDYGTEISSFIDFLKTGELGQLSLRLSVEEVYNLLGKPSHSHRPFEGTDQDHLLNLRYKNLTVTFYDEHLAIYIIQFQNGFKPVRGELPNQLNARWFSKVKKMTFDEFIELIKTNGIRCEKLVTDDSEGHLIRFPESGVEVSFDLGIRNGIYQIDCSKTGPENRHFEEIL